MAEVERETEKPKTSTRDLDDVHARLTAWLVAQLPYGAAPEIGALSRPTSGGMSSETVLFDATWNEEGDQGGSRRCRSLVARLAPEASAVPVFPRYDLDRQARVIRLVGERTGVPVPLVRWFEPDAASLGSPFIVMDQVDGIAPPDVMPYNFGSWLMEAARVDQRRLQDASVSILADIHGVDATPEELAFLAVDAPGDSALRRHVNDLVAYYEWVRGDLHVPVIERGFGWIEANWPTEEGKAVVSWGDSRIGNILYRDFEPVAVLDWEMAAVAPREVDIGWMIFIHDFFEHVARQIELPGMPHFMRREDVAGVYEAASGVAPRNLEFYEVYAALRHAVVMARVTLRAIHFGESEMPDDRDELVLHRVLLSEMMNG